MNQRKRNLSDKASKSGKASSRRSPGRSSFSQFFTLPTLHPVRPWRDGLGLGLLFVAALLLYAVSMPRTVMLEDDGFFITAAHFAGVAHPPGYPVYVALGWLATHLPVGSVAWRVHLLSGVMGALTCACIAFLVLRRTGHRPAAWLAGAALAVSKHFWSQAIIADVYTTNAALLFLALVCTQEAAVKGDGRYWLVAAGLYGLGLANHWPLLLLASPVLVAYVGAVDFRRRVAGLALVAGLVAAGWYGWMVWRSHQAPPINFLGPIESWDELVAFIRRDIYAGVDTNVNAGLLDKVLFAWHFVGQAVLQFSPLGAVIAGWGMMATWQAGWRLGLLCEAGAFAAGSFGLIAVLGFDYTPFWVAVARPYYLVPYGILALWLGYGVHAGVQVLRAWIDGEVGGTSTHRGVHTVGQVLRIRADRLLPALYVAAGLGIVALGIVNADENYRPHDRFAAEQAQMILDLVEENGVLVIHGDGYTAPLAYLHFVEGLRHDVRILTSNGWVFHDRIIDPAWPMERAGSAMLEFFNESSRPVYVPAHDELSGFGLRNLGFLKMLDPSVTPGRTVFDSNLRAKEFFKQMLAMPESKDIWTFEQKKALVGIYGVYLGYARLLNHFELNRHVEDVLPLAEENYWALSGMCEILLKHGTTDRHVELVASLVQKAKQLAQDDKNKLDPSLVSRLEDLLKQKRSNIRSQRGSRKHFGALNA